MSLPRGIQELKRTNKDGSVVVRYRVQINKKDFKADRLFDEKDEAVEFLLASKSFTGKSKIKLLEEQKKQEMKIMQDYIANPTLSTYIDKYIETYVDRYYQDMFKERKLDLDSPEGKMKVRNYKSTKTFYKTIKNTQIPERSDEKFEISGLFFKPNHGLKKFGDLKPVQITYIEINEYIKARLKQGLKPISIQRELTNISNVFKKLKHLDYRLEHLPNPVMMYDRDLLKQKGKKKIAFRLNDDDRKKFIAALDAHPNPELGQIVRLMLLTAMRRSEAVLLKWSDIHEKHIHLTHTKSGEPRDVTLIPQARELLNSIPRRPNDDRVFTYTVLGFQGSYDKLLERTGLKINTHGLRKESLSNFIEEIGAGNSILIAEFLGLGSVKALEQFINDNKQSNGLNTQADVLRSVGHSNSTVTHKHYFSLRK